MNNAISYNIYRAMYSRKISLTQLSKRLNCDRSGLYKRLNNPSLFRVEELIKIGAAIGVDWHELLEGVE